MTPTANCPHVNLVPWTMVGEFEARQVQLCQDCGATVQTPSAPAARAGARDQSQGLGGLVRRITGQLAGSRRG